ncbi:hypothetical protein QQF64_035738, partial [Cirrhinus molitorella]
YVHAGLDPQCGNDEMKAATQKRKWNSRDTITKMAFIKVEIEDIKIEETFRVKQEDIEEQTAQVWDILHIKTQVN